MHLTVNTIYLRKKKIFFRIYNISKYSFKSKKNKSFESDKNLRILYPKIPVKSTSPLKYISMVFLVHYHNTPHVLVVKNKFQKNIFLPGGRSTHPKTNFMQSYKFLYDKTRKKSKNFFYNANIEKWFFMKNENRIKYSFLPPHFLKKKLELDVNMLQLNECNEIKIKYEWDILAVPFFEINENTLKYNLVISKLSGMLH